MVAFCRKHLGFFLYSGCFALLAVVLFWGTWSPDCAPVMPDDSIAHNLDWAKRFAYWWESLGQTGKLAPHDLLWSGVFFSPYWVQELKYVMGLYLAGLGLAFFLRGRGLSQVASFGAALFLAFCGYWSTLFSAGHGGWFIWMLYGTFLFGFIDRAVETKRYGWWVLLGLFAAWASFVQQDLWLLFSLFTAVYLVWRCFRAHVFPYRGIIVAGVTFACVGLPGIKDAIQNILRGRVEQIKEGNTISNQNATSAEKQWEFVTNWSLPPEDTLEFFCAGVHGDTSCPMTLQMARRDGKDIKPYTGRLGRPMNAPSGNYRQHSLYVGWMTCLMVLVALITAFRGKSATVFSEGLSVPCRADLLFFVCAALLFYLFSLGRFCAPVYRVIFALPYVDLIRCPVKWHHLTELCLCILAGYGLEEIFQFLRTRAPASVRTWAGAIVSVLVFVGAANLVANDRLFCAPIDLSVVRNPNPAAALVAREGGGTVVDLVEGGNGIIAWGFCANGVGMTRNPTDKDVRFVWVPLRSLSEDKGVSAWLKAKACLVGQYLVTAKGIHACPNNSANVALFQMNGIPPPLVPKPKPADSLALALLGVSVVAVMVSLSIVYCSLVRKDA